MNLFIYPVTKVFIVAWLVIILDISNIFCQENNSKDFIINPRLKLNKAFFGFEQVRIKNKNFNIFLYGGITRMNFSSIDEISKISLKHMAGISYNPAYNIAGLRLNSGISILGIYTRINIAYHTNFKYQSVILKPSIGIDLKIMTLTWGPNIILIHGLDKYFQKSNFCFELIGFL